MTGEGERGVPFDCTGSRIYIYGSALKHYSSNTPFYLLLENCSRIGSMKLRLSCWAEDLPVTDGLFCVLTVLHKEYGVKPTVLGQSEVLSGTHSPDWTKTFYLDDYEMGHETHLVVSLYRGRNVAVGSTLFEVGQVLGHAGSLAKQLKDGGGIVAVHIEESGNQSSGQLYLHLRGVQLKNMDGFGLLNKSDPFVELQRARLTTTGKSVWDAVYRSTALDNTLDPLFPEIFMDLEDLLGTTAALAAPTATDFRIAIYDWEKSGKHGLIGACIVNINDLMSRVDVTALQGVTPVALEKAIILKNTSNKETGKLIVVQADATGTPSVPVASSIAVPIIATGTSVPTAAVEALDTGVEAEISLADTAVSTDELVATDAGDLGRLRPTFCNYMAGGCQLRVTIAIDSTASNGDPRQDSSLHYFCGEGLNRYEQALQGICSIMTKYDSDQKYPVYGFGAKRDGVIRHCFPFSTTNTSAEVEGVEGILQIYREVFRSGIVMSSPRDFSEVIRSTGTNAKNHFVR